MSIRIYLICIDSFPPVRLQFIHTDIKVNIRRIEFTPEMHSVPDIPTHIAVGKRTEPSVSGLHGNRTDRLYAGTVDTHA